MLDINKHKFFIITLLKEIYADIELASSLGFKGGTAHMLFYGLPRFSVDLDFNLLKPERSKSISKKIRSILLKHGDIRDEAEKHYGLLIVLNYGSEERNLKVEISNRNFPDNYEIKNYLGISMNVMVKPDLFSHKLCALLDRNIVINRDIFDIYYFMKQKTPLNKDIIEKRMKMLLNEYLLLCITKIESIKSNNLLNGLGELVDENLKSFVRTKLKEETLQLLNIYREFPLLT